MAQTQARKLAAKPMVALVETKRLMKKGHMATVLAQMTEGSFARCCKSLPEAFSTRSWKSIPDFSQL